MGPKPRVQKRKETVEEARKKKKVSTSTSSPSSKAPLTFRSVSFGKNVDFDFLEEEGFSIGQKIIKQGWRNFCSLNLDTSLDLVREFYHNFDSSFNLITSLVKGKDIHITTSILARVLDIPLVEFYDDSDTDKRTKMELILNREDIALDRIELKDLSVEMRVLHHIACKIISPRAGRFDYVSEQDISIMFHVLAELPFNLPALIMDTMCEAVRRTKTILPYGMLLTKIFRIQGVDMSDETMSPLLHTDTFGIHTFRRMGFSKVNGVWFTKEARAQLNEEEGPSSPVAPEIPSQEHMAFETSAAPEYQSIPPEQFMPAQSAPQTQFSQIPEVRLPEDQLMRLADRVAEVMLAAQRPSQSISEEHTLVPHMSQIASSLTEIHRKLDYVQYELVRLSARVGALESRLDSLPSSSGPSYQDTIQISELTVEAARLRGIVQEGMKVIQADSRINLVNHNLERVAVQLELLQSICIRGQQPSQPSQTAPAPASRSRRRGTGSSSRHAHDISSSDEE